VITSLVVIYLCGWMFTTAAALTAARALTDTSRVPGLRGYALTSAVAGAIWPLLLVGVAELGALIGCTKTKSRSLRV
jgi:hypothetical protein